MIAGKPPLGTETIRKGVSENERDPDLRIFCRQPLAQARRRRLFRQRESGDRHGLGACRGLPVADIDHAVAAAKRAFHEGPWGRMHAAERGRYLRRSRYRLGARRAAGCGRARDNGKLPGQITPGLQAGGWSVDSWHYYAGMCDKFEDGYSGRGARHPQLYDVGAVRRGRQILPWNSPIGTLIRKLAPACRRQYRGVETSSRQAARRSNSWTCCRGGLPKAW